jgi:hypothetical protein
METWEGICREKQGEREEDRGENEWENYKKIELVEPREWKIFNMRIETRNKEPPTREINSLGLSLSLQPLATWWGTRLHLISCGKQITGL